MKLDNAARVCELSRDMPVTNFTIEANSQMIRILSDQLYTDKELAILRELVANAWDAHVAAGTTDTPFKVHLPTELEPWFAVEDYGTGLSPAQVTTLYTTYGRSDKTHTNDLIGGFGLGSKSPFCYTDQFTVRSRWNGTEYVYQAFIQGDGMPSCAFIGEAPTDQPNGLTVHVPIADNSGYHRFEDAARRIIPFVPTKPIVNSPETYDLPPMLIDLTDPAPGVKRIAIGAQSEYGRPMAFVQGLVPYRVNPIELLRRGDGRNPDWWDLTAHRVYIWVDVGTLEVTASRESLSMTQKVRDRAQKLLYTSMQVVLEKLHERLDTAATTWWDWVTIAADLPATPPRAPERLGNRDRYGIRAEKLAARSNAIRLARDHQVKAGFRRDEIETLNIVTLREHDKIYVKPKTSFPYRDFVTDLFADNPDVQRIYVLTGEARKIEAELRRFGMPHKVVEIPKIKAHRSKVKRGAMGAKRYRNYRLYYHAESKQWEARMFYEKAADVIDGLPANALVLREFNLRLGSLSTLLNAGLVELNTATEIWTLDINAGHTKVREAFLTAAAPDVITLDELRALLTPNVERIEMAKAAWYFDRDERFKQLRLFNAHDRHQLIAKPAGFGLRPFKDLRDSLAALQIAGESLNRMIIDINAIEFWVGDEYKPHKQVTKAIEEEIAFVEETIEEIARRYPELATPVRSGLRLYWYTTHPAQQCGAALYNRVAQFYAQQETQQ